MALVVADPAARLFWLVRLSAPENGNVQKNATGTAAQAIHISSGDTSPNEYCRI